MNLADKIKFAVKLRMTSNNFLFLAAGLALAMTLPFGAYLLS